MSPTIKDIIATIEEKALPKWQEDFDNTGWQILLPDILDKICTGVLLCVDATVPITLEARRRKCNLIITHHPLLFRPIKRIEPGNRVGETIMSSIANGISIYSCHTSIDAAPQGISHLIARKLGLVNISVLGEEKDSGVGIGVVGDFNNPVGTSQLLDNIKSLCKSPVARCSGLSENGLISRVAIGCGACGDFIPNAIDKGAEIMITSDLKHNHFIDFAGKIGLIDLGHYETENCTKELFYEIITEKFPNFVPYYSQEENNPITYI